MLIEFHVIQDHGPANMNRDRNGMPKTAFYGGVQRLRVSSQCIKRSLRQPKPADGKGEAGVFESTVGSAHFGVRTRLLPEVVGAKWRELHGADDSAIDGIKVAVSTIAKKEGEAEPSSDGRIRTPQLIFLELDREADRIIAVLNELKASGELDQLTDPSQLFADQLKTAAQKLTWQEKLDISWDGVKSQWTQLKNAYEQLDVDEQPQNFDPTLSAEQLKPTADFAEGLIQLLMAVQARDQKQAKSLLKSMKGKVKSASKSPLVERLKLTSDRPVSAADIALFGRMTTSDAFRDVEAACQVADAISTHEADLESDFFTAVDDLDVGSGAGHMGDAAFASAVFYKYASLDYDKLIDNLGGNLPAGKEDDEELKQFASQATQTAARSIEGLLRALMHNVPSGKINSHAHNQQPSLILVEVKQKKLATSYLTAFHDPARGGARPDGTIDSPLSDSVAKLIRFAGKRDAKMPIDGTQRFLFTFDDATEGVIKRLRESPVTTAFLGQDTFKECGTFEDLVSAVVGTVEKA